MSNILSSAVALVIVHLSVYLLIKNYQHRQKIAKLRDAGVPMPKSWSWIYGHILYIDRITRTRLPHYSNVNNVWPVIAADFADEEMFLVDIWPFMDAVVVVFNPEAASHVAQTLNLPKTQSLDRMLRPITGGPTMLSMNDDEWKRWRNLFNPGFSPAAMMEQIPRIVDSVTVFTEKLVESIGKGVVLLDDLTSRLSFEVILKVILNEDADHQRKDHVLGNALGKITQWHSFHDPMILWNPLRPFIQGYNSRLITKYLEKELDQLSREAQRESSPGADVGLKSAKSVASLAIKDYNSASPITNGLNKTFARMTTYQIRLFLLAGNDTTSSTLVFAYHLLSKNPESLNRLRREYEEIFGGDPSRAAFMLKKQPSLIHSCHFTLAVIKETLRLFPPASALRNGTGGQLTTHNGVTFSTDGLSIILSHITMHKSSRLFPSPEAFLPDRWLVGPDHYLHPPKNAYRPFELGPRNCIGQVLSINEMKVALIMTVRVLNIQPAYEEFDGQNERSGGILSTLGRLLGLQGDQIKTLNGDRAFQTEKAGGHPSDRYPCLISARAATT